MSLETMLINKYNMKQITLERFVDLICGVSRYYCCDLIEYYGKEEEALNEDFINRLATDKL